MKTKHTLFFTCFIALLCINAVQAQNQAIKLNAVDFDYTNSKPVKDSDGKLKRVNDGCALGFYQVDFKNGLQGVRLNYIGLFDFEATVEVRLDNIDGQLLASIPLSKIVDISTFIKSEARFSSHIDGIHNVFFIFKGGDRLGIFDSFELISKNAPVVDETQPQFFPNPVADAMTISSAHPIQNVSIYDLAGRKLMEQKTNELDVSSLPSGTYLVTLITNNKAYVHKMVKQ